MSKGTKLDEAIREAARTNLTPDELSDINHRIAIMSYWLAQEVAQAYRAYANAEGERKAYMARHVIEMQASGASNAKAQATVEGSEGYQALRAKEIEAEVDHVKWRHTMDGVKNVLASLQMRIALLRDEMKRAV